MFRLYLGVDMSWYCTKHDFLLHTFWMWNRFSISCPTNHHSNTFQLLRQQSSPQNPPQTFHLGKSPSKNHYTSLHQLLFCSQIGLFLRNPFWNYVQNPLVTSSFPPSCHPAKGTKVLCTDGSAICGKSQGVCKGTWQLRFIQPQVCGWMNQKKNMVDIDIIT